MGCSVSAEQQREVWEAVDRADIAEVQRLVHKEAPIEIFTSFSNPNWRLFGGGMTVVMKTAFEDLYDILQLVITTHPLSINVKNENGWTALTTAVRHNKLKSAQLLVDKGADMNIQNNVGFTALMLALDNDMSQNIARLLIEAGAALDLQNLIGLTALMFAVERNSVEIVRLLVEKGSALDVKSNTGWTALMIAVNAGNLECAQLLIDKGANLNFQNNNGFGDTALMIAVYYNKLDCCRLLIGAGAALDQKNRDGWTGLIFAVRNSNEEIVGLLLDAGAAPALRDNRGRTALDFTHGNGDHKIVSLLVKKLKWFSRRDFLMFLATQSYLPPAPPPLADSMSRDELNAYYQQFHNPETRPNTAVHSVFFMQELQRYIMNFLSPDMH